MWWGAQCKSGGERWGSWLPACSALRLPGAGCWCRPVGVPAHLDLPALPAVHSARLSCGQARRPLCRRQQVGECAQRCPTGPSLFAFGRKCPKQLLRLLYLLDQLPQARSLFRRPAPRRQPWFGSGHSRGWLSQAGPGLGQRHNLPCWQEAQWHLQSTQKNTQVSTEPARQAKAPARGGIVLD